MTMISVGQIRRHPINVILFAVFWGILSALVGGLVAPHVRDGTSLQFKIIGFLESTVVFFLLVSFAASVAFLLLRKWAAVLSCAASGCIFYLSIVAALMLKGDRFAFTSGPHREIAEIYNEHIREFETTNSEPRLVDLVVKIRHSDSHDAESYQ
jgi:hypothetical protein